MSNANNPSAQSEARFMNGGMRHRLVVDRHGADVPSQDNRKREEKRHNGTQEIPRNTLVVRN